MQKRHPDTVGALITWCAEALEKAGVFCGHGTANVADEAAVLVFSIAGLSHDADDYDSADGVYAQPIDRQQFDRAQDILRQRIDRRIPLPYLLEEAWFAGLKFFVDERVLIPRSPFAELIESGFSPWLSGAPVERVLEIGTGSACIAIACAHAFPDSEVLATDLSSDALNVARINVARHGLEGRVQLLRADLFDGVSGRFDLIVSNPPYVPSGEIEDLPAEYASEPALALAAGADGLALSRRILQDAAVHLRPGGTLALEVGAGWRDLEAAFPHTPFTWPEFERGGEGIALLGEAALATVNSSSPGS
jgi:ribosomal protein L3 glutamine methyltransferase